MLISNVSSFPIVSAIYLFYCPIICKVNIRYEAPAVWTSQQRLEYDRSLFLHCRCTQVATQHPTTTVWDNLYHYSSEKILNNYILFYTFSDLFMFYFHQEL